MNPIFAPQILAFQLTTYIALTLVILFFAVIKQLFESTKEANRKREGAPAGPPQPQQRPQPAMPKPAQAGGQQADPLRSQVEEFLRRAGRQPQAAQPAQSSKTPQRRPASEIELLELDSSGPAERQRLAAQSSSAGTRTSPAVTQAAADKPRVARRALRRQSVAEHVAERVASRSQTLADKTAQLGQRIVTEDLQFDNQLKAKFDHAVGTLAENAFPVPDQVAPSPPDTPAGQIAAMLANPDGVRQAIVLNEILRRPSDRW
jgi:hypothetical protein